MVNGFVTEQAFLSDGKTALPIYHYSILDSTNAEAKRRGTAKSAVILADRQTAGRGRLGRQFFSEGGIYTSIILPAESLSFSPMLLTSAAAFAVCRAVRAAGFDAKIKWVNDILLDGKKICGILAEAMSGENGISGFVVGIGINIGNPDFPSELADIAGTLPLSNAEKEVLLHAIIQGFFDALAMPPREMLAYCAEQSAVIGKKVRFFGAKEGVGRALGLSCEGGLTVLTDEGTVTLTGGEISLRVE